jgi:hypothetical protein
MSLLEVNKITPQSGTTLTLGDTGDTINFGSGVLPNFENLTVTGDLTVDTNSLYVDSANNRVGIGTASPSAELHVYNNATSSQIRVQNNDGVAKFQKYQDDLYITNDDTGDILFNVSDSETEAMRINSSGKVGIGTSSPTRTLSIVSTGTDTGGAYIYSNAIHTGTDIQSLLSVRSDNSSSTGTVVDIRGDGTGDILNVKDTTNTALIVKDGGNVGIGTSSPSEKLEVSTSGTTSIRITGGDSNSQQVKFFSATQQNGAIYSYYNFASPYLALINNGSERMRIDSSGNVGIGTTSPNNHLVVNGGVATIGSASAGLTTGMLFDQTASTLCRILCYSATDSSLAFYTGSSSSASERMRIDSSGNVGIGTTSPTGSGQVLHLNSSTTVTDFHMTNSTTGSASTDGLVIRQSGLNSEILNREAGNTIFYNNGAESMRIDSSGDVIVGGNLTGNGIIKNKSGDQTAGNPQFTFVGNVGTGMRRASIDTIAFDTGSVERMRITSSGNVGIGTTSPNKDGITTALTINSPVATNYSGIELSTADTLRTALISNSNGGFLYTATAIPLVFQTNNTERMRITSSGNVGIGTSSPSFALSVSSTSSNTITAINTTSNISRFCFAENSTPSNTFTNIEGDARSSGYMAFRTNDTERMRINSTGDVSIGSTANSGYKLKVDAQGDSRGAGYMLSNVFNQPSFEITNTNTSDYAQSVLWLQCNRTTTNGSYNFLRVIQSGVTDKLFIRDSGNVVNANNSYGAISDLKLKEQITDASSQWLDIKNIQIKKFKFKHEVAEGDSDNLWKLGVVAQEIETVSPSLVETVKDIDKDGNAVLDDEGNETFTKNVKYSVLYMKAVKALQEAMLKIENLEARVDTLEGN